MVRWYRRRPALFFVWRLLLVAAKPAFTDARADVRNSRSPWQIPRQRRRSIPVRLPTLPQEKASRKQKIYASNGTQASSSPSRRHADDNVYN